MDEIARNPDDYEGGDNPPDGSHPKEEHQHQPSTPQKKSEYPHGKLGRFLQRHWQQWKDVPVHDKSNAVFTIVIAVATTVYAFVTIRQLGEMRSSGAQATEQAKKIIEQTTAQATNTNNLAISAGKQADAAKKQSEQAEAQTDTMRKSLIKTDSLIKATSALARETARQANISRDAMNASMKSADQDRRPWVGLPDFKCNECIADTNGSLSVGSMFGIMENSGKTPAIKMVVNAAFTSRIRTEDIPDYESESAIARIRDPYKAPDWMQPADADKLNKTLALTKKFTEPPVVVLPPNAVRRLPLIGSFRGDRIPTVRYEDEKIFYVVGKITYSSTTKPAEIHTTKFCLMNDSGPNFRFCPTGNDMD
jgi:hypothetical protein